MSKKVSAFFFILKCIIHYFHILQISIKIKAFFFIEYQYEINIPIYSTISQTKQIFITKKNKIAKINLILVHCKMNIKYNFIKSKIEVQRELLLYSQGYKISNTSFIVGREYLFGNLLYASYTSTINYNYSKYQIINVLLSDNKNKL